MSFYTYAQNIRLDKRNDKQYLVAKVATGSSAGGDEAGWYIDPICLDDHIGNDRGSFTWSAEGVPATTPEISSCSTTGGFWRPSSRPGATTVLVAGSMPQSFWASAWRTTTAASSILNECMSVATRPYLSRV